MAHIPSKIVFNSHNHLVMLIENAEIETSDTNLVMTYDAGIYMFPTDKSAKRFANSINSAMLDPVAKAFTKS
jgi:hypothetical protein